MENKNKNNTEQITSDYIMKMADQGKTIGDLNKLIEEKNEFE